MGTSGICTACMFKRYKYTAFPGNIQTFTGLFLPNHRFINYNLYFYLLHFAKIVILRVTAKKNVKKFCNVVEYLVYLHTN